MHAAQSETGLAKASQRLGRLLVVVGARPNFVKVAPVWHALQRTGALELELLHTGQHYDRALSGSFLDQLRLPDPHHVLGVGSGTHAEQTAAVLIGTEKVLSAGGHDAVLAAGDVNSTLAAALAAAKLGVGVIHLEAGLRSTDWSMPEEINRVLTDRLSDLLLCPSDDAPANLAAEGIDRRVEMVGNTMIDTLLEFEAAAGERGVPAALGLEPGGYVLVTLHRPGLVDEPALLGRTLRALGVLADRLPVVFPVHPRTRARLADAHVSDHGVRLLDPLDYLDFLGLMRDARLVVTDSGGVQEETSVLGVPCLTYRTTTERPVTVTLGTNELVGLDPAVLARSAERVIAAPRPERPAIPLWDGRAGERAADAIVAAFRDGLFGELPGERAAA